MGQGATGPWAERRRLLVAGIWSLAVLASAVQIYLRELSDGVAPPWLAVLVANLLAWLPWLLLAAPILRLERRLPLNGPARWRNVAVHLGLAGLVAAAFLLYLALFHLLYLEGVSLPLSAAAVRAEYGEKLGRFFLTAAALYGVIVLAGFTERTWRELRLAAAKRAPGLAAGPGPIVVRSTGRVERIDPVEVRWIAAEGNYARLQLDGRSVLHRASLSALAADLDGRFARIHRSIVVNLRHVRAVERRSHGDAFVVLDDGSRLRMSRTYRKALKRLVS